MTYADAIHFLYDLRLFGLKLGLENTFKLAALAGNPQERLRFIHVAGTNGKGSTCAMLESVYRAAGLRVGLFTSPHLVSFRERVQVNRQLLSEADVTRLVAETQEWLKEFPHDHHPTFFEFVTVMALRYFAEQECDLVIWETGMGGRLDATNIVTPLASVITNIGFDHQQWLGDTLAKIAAEKAGIIKPGVPVITATDEPEALAVIEQTAKKLNAPLTKVGQASRLSGPVGSAGRPSETSDRFSPSGKEGALGWAGETPALPLLGAHQRLNAALAIATVRALADKTPVSEPAMREGLARVEWPGRLQVIKRGGQTLLLDGAHNVTGAKALRDALQKYLPGHRPVLIFGVLADKDWSHICEVLAPLADRIFTTPVASDRSAAAPDLAEACRRAQPQVDALACGSLQEALERAASGPFVVITGSLYLVGEALEQLGLAPSGATSERGLNEWSPVR
ncbi:MAG: bifunctional folylpolyglutamate synthase/dihydrofolate synthase [Verrucomicrobia bacterium]|nr:bifunctional folylpolyglutamate synthase/dihydrofolate synthase [Verrucomicrobiota bacterium]